MPTTLGTIPVLTHPRLKFSTCFFVLAALLSAAIAAPSARAQARISDKDLEALMKNLRDDAKSFRPGFDSALKKSSIRKTSQEKDARNLAARFEKQTDNMLNRFKRTRKADAELSSVRASAAQLDSLVRTLNLGAHVSSRWDKIQTELQRVSSAFGAQTSSLDNPRGISAGSETGSVICTQVVGEERANTLVRNAWRFRPPHTDLQYSEPLYLIVGEIRRGCSLLDARNSTVFCSDDK